MIEKTKESKQQTNQKSSSYYTQRIEELQVYLKNHISHNQSIFH